MRVRILPTLIFIAVMMFSLKVGNIWQGMSAQDSGIHLKPTFAAESDVPPGASPGPADQPETASAADNILGEERTSAPAIERAPAPAAQDQSVDPQLLSRSEIRLLQALAERRRVLDRREQSLNQRESLLKAVEQQLVDQQSKLVSMRRKLVGLLNQLDDKEKRRIGNLVKIYENMKPKDAANIFNDLELPVLLGVIERMKARKLAPVIAAMKPDIARMVTRSLAKRQNTAMTSKNVADRGTASQK